MVRDNHPSARSVAFKTIPFILIIALIGVIAACAPRDTKSAPTAAPKVEVSSLETADATTALTPVDWKTDYPDQFSTWGMTSNQSETSSYNEEYSDFLATVYNGTPFSKDYTHPRGHAYTLEDVNKTARISEKSTATCYACKTSDYTLLEQEMGPALYSTPFADVTDKMKSGLTCYDCHANQPSQGSLATRPFFNTAYPTAAADWGGDSMASCGQCHNEYYFNTTDKGVTLPVQTNATDMLAYYNSINFVDYTNPDNGVKQLKAQHPEVTMVANGPMKGLTCAECHMEVVTREDGTTYTSHEITTARKSEYIRENVCSKCHSGDIVAYIDSVQATTEARESEVGMKLADLHNKLTAAVSSGAYSEDELDAVRAKVRDAQWYWDYEFVENSSGVHNNTEATHDLDMADQIADEALAMLNK